MTWIGQSALSLFRLAKSHAQSLSGNAVRNWIKYIHYDRVLTRDVDMFEVKMWILISNCRSIDQIIEKSGFTRPFQTTLHVVLQSSLLRVQSTLDSAWLCRLPINVNMLRYLPNAVKPFYKPTSDCLLISKYIYILHQNIISKIALYIDERSWV